ncbi:uncharacterized protein LOC126285041 [Schistocerca gregaria]|uniref:uncharacterized protein LOC126285041 n=1 Tax=Schistocerca gregaria TaxID=7010 RepID=UPI00211E2FD2|nr:uncharacterized protein LOC126285041 [Schistocerca gregaria]
MNPQSTSHGESDEECSKESSSAEGQAAPAPSSNYMVFEVMCVLSLTKIHEKTPCCNQNPQWEEHPARVWRPRRRQRRSWQARHMSMLRAELLKHPRVAEAWRRRAAAAGGGGGKASGRHPLLDGLQRRPYLPTLVALFIFLVIYVLRRTCASLVRRS